MKLPANLEVARTHLLSRKKQTIIAILGVTFGISLFILMISFMKGVDDYYHDSMLMSTPDIRMYGDIPPDPGISIAGEYFRRKGNEHTDPLVMMYDKRPRIIPKGIKDPFSIIRQVRKDPKVVAVSPVLSTPVVFQNGNSMLNGLIEGVDMIEELKLSGLAGKMYKGQAESLSRTNRSILLGKGLSDKLNAGIGDMVELRSPSGDIGRYKVVGIFQYGMGMIDNVRAYMRLEDIQQLLGKTPDYVTDIHVKLKNMDEAGAVAASLSKRYGYAAMDWATANASVLAGNKVRNMLTSIVSISLLIVAGFGIYNIMNMNIAGKLKDIAILKTLGYKGRDIMQIFLSQSLIIGIIGALLGLVLGYVFCRILSRTEFPKSDLIVLKYYPVRFQAGYYVFGLLFGVITTFLAGFSPSLKAARTDPVDILRG
jgi:lipoprotein-releasing system permease protein